MKIYIDNDFKCHTVNARGYIEVDTDVFNGKCKEFIEGYCYIPQGMSYERTDGKILRGELVFPWRDYNEIAEIQTAVDRTQAEADEQIMGLLDTIEELIIGG